MNTASTYKQALQKAGLNQNESDLYLYLLEHGKTTVQQLLKDTGLKRGNLYHLLYSLRDQGLAIQTEESKKLHFQLSDPSSLRPLLDLQRQKVQDTIREVEGILPELTSAYTLTYRKPGIDLFEGEEAMRRVLEDTLTATGEVRQYADAEAFLGQYPEVNAAYVKRRKKLGQHKRIISPEGPASLAYAANQIPEEVTMRFMPAGTMIKNVFMYMYDKKLSYLTLQEGHMIGFIIEDPLLAQMHASLFDFQWDSLARTP